MHHVSKQAHRYGSTLFISCTVILSLWTVHTAAAISDDTCIDAGSHIHAVSSLRLFTGAQPLPQVVVLKFLL